MTISLRAPLRELGLRALPALELLEQLGSVQRSGVTVVNVGHGLLRFARHRGSLRSHCRRSVAALTGHWSI